MIAGRKPGYTILWFTWLIYWNLTGKRLIYFDSMLSYNQCDQTTVQDLEWLEFFAGVGNLTRQMKSAQHRAVRFDILDHTPPNGSKRSNFMDLSTASGYAFLELIFVTRWGGGTAPTVSLEIGTPLVRYWFGICMH